MRITLALLAGLGALVIGSLSVGVVLWPLFRLAEAYSPALGRSGALAFITVSLAGPFFGGVFAGYWPLQWFPGVDRGLFRGLILGVVSTLLLLGALLGLLQLSGGEGIFVLVLALLQIAGTALGLSVGLALVPDQPPVDG